MRGRKRKRHDDTVSSNRDINKEIIQRKILELRNTTEMKISLEGLNSRFELAEELVNL